MKILLDIDGVMVPVSSWKTPPILNDGFAAFSDQASKALRKIIDRSNASIVLTTSHKSVYTIEQWKAIFKHRGIEASIDRLPNNDNNLSRKDEILHWLSISTTDFFVILDDDTSLNDLPPLYKERLVLCSSMIGLNNDAADKAISILNKDY